MLAATRDLLELTTLLVDLPPGMKAAPDFAELRRVHGWALASHGLQAPAREALMAAAQLCLSQGRRTDALVLLHDVVRLGDAALAGRELIATAAQVQGEFTLTRAAHASAALNRDPAGLAAAGERFAAPGAQLLAAEALLAAAARYRADDERRHAAACASRAAAQIVHCEGASTPGLLVDSGHVPLSEREREIAVLVARGFSSREIAGQLVISVRTVDNHLQNVYSKLGVNSRAEVAEAIGASGATRSGKDTRK